MNGRGIASRSMLPRSARPREERPAALASRRPVAGTQSHMLRVLDTRFREPSRTSHLLTSVLRHSVMDTTTPAPTVLPPSRIANRCFSSIAIGVISSTSIAALSPGMIISVPAGSVTCPVTSVVRK
jgi:hypothetical protein